MIENKTKLAGNLHKYDFGQADNVWSIKGISPTILASTVKAIGHQINILEENDGKGDKGN